MIVFDITKGRAFYSTLCQNLFLLILHHSNLGTQKYVIFKSCLLTPVYLKTVFGHLKRTQNDLRTQKTTFYEL